MDALGADLFSSLKQNLGNLSGDDLKQAENIWKMLDNMSENNPEGYKNFVNTNVQKGFEDIKKDSKIKLENEKVQAEPIFLLKMQANIDEYIIQKEDNPLYEKIKKLDSKNIPQLSQIKSKFDKNVKIYINVMINNRVKGPLSAKGQEIQDVKEELENWSVIPYSVQNPEERKSVSLGHKVYFYNFVLNDNICNTMGKSPLLGDQLVSFIIDKMQNCLKMHRNPLINQYDFKQYEHILYYKIEKMSILKHKKKKFKFLDGKNNIPMILLEPEADKNKQITQKTEQKQEQVIYKNSNQTAQQENQLVLDGLKITSKQEEQATKKKKVIIEEISSEVHQNNEDNEKKPILREQEPLYSVKEDKDQICVEVQLEKVDNFSDIILDISEWIVKIEVVLVYSVEIKLPFKIDNEKSIPKWNKKNKILKLILKK